MSKILVTGGCGYIGSHTIIDLIDNGFDVVSIDNYLNSDSGTLSQIQAVTGKTIKNYQIDLTNIQATKKVFLDNPDISGIIHFAALKSVEESVNKPLLYFNNNLGSLLNMLHWVAHFKIPNFIFSSSCSVYGNAKELPVTEKTVMSEAESPYARTKQVGEGILQDFAKRYKQINTISLRYFNPAGAHESALIGESPINKASNLVPVITEVAAGKREQLTVFGTDYETRDGSCIRDYIHVMDIADAHTKALQYLLDSENTTNCEVFNIGTGKGVSVLEAINAFESVTGVKLNYKKSSRRAGDVVAVYANTDKASNLLGWTPKRDIKQIMKTAWNWELVKNKELITI